MYRVLADAVVLVYGAFVVFLAVGGLPICGDDESA